MTNFRLLPIVACLALAAPTHAAEEAPRSEQRSACEQAIHDGPTHVRAEDADFDGNGACALDDGRVRKQSRENGGASGTGDLGGDDAALGRRRFVLDGDEHQLVQRGRVVTVSVGTEELRGAFGGVAYGARSDLFTNEVGYTPVDWAWDAALPGYDTVQRASLDNGHLALITVAEGPAAAMPGSTGGPLTSRSGGRMLDEADAGATVPTSPVPEPATWAMLLAGAGLLAWRRRRA